MAADASEFAPAKINLTLHVTGQRADGYHLLDSLVVFADVGDRVQAVLADQLSLTIDGPQAGNLPVMEDNLVLRAARAMGVSAVITLTKVLPVSSGIGGGSADAAAALRLLSRLSRKMLPDAAEAVRLGADVPVCLAGRAVRMTGVGEGLHAVTGLPEAWLVLVNPGVAVSTPSVFRALNRRDNPAMPQDLPRLRGFADLAAFVAMQRNDMEPAAISLAPVISSVKSALTSQSGCAVARMSGSGATCFGLFPDGLTATAAARQIEVSHPGWWVAAARMIS